MNESRSRQGDPISELNRRVRALRLGWLGTFGLYGISFTLIHLFFYLYAALTGGAGIYHQVDGGTRIAAWAWWFSFLVPALVCLAFLRSQDLRNREQLTRTWDSWRWFDHGADMFATEFEYSQDQERSFARAVSLDPDDPYALNNLGSVYLQQGRFEEAITVLQRAIKLNSDYHKAYCNLGTAYARLGKTGRAVGFYRKALKLNPRNPDAHLNLGAALAGLGKRTQAVTHLRTFIQLAPDHPRKKEVSDLLSRLV